MFNIRTQPRTAGPLTDFVWLRPATNRNHTCQEVHEHQAPVAPRITGFSNRDKRGIYQMQFELRCLIVSCLPAMAKTCSTPIHLVVFNKIYSFKKMYQIIACFFLVKIRGQLCSPNYFTSFCGFSIKTVSSRTILVELYFALNPPAWRHSDDILCRHDVMVETFFMHLLCKIDAREGTNSFVLIAASN